MTMTTFAQFAADLDFKLDCTYSGVDARRFKWNIDVQYQDTHMLKLYEVEYHMGLAHCTKYEGRFSPIVGRGVGKVIAKEACSFEIAKALYPFRRITLEMAEGYVIPTPPSVSMVLQSLQLDSQAGDNTFVDFCSDFVYDSDSREAYTIWIACVETRANVKKWLGTHYETFMQLTEE